MISKANLFYYLGQADKRGAFCAEYISTATAADQISQLEQYHLGSADPRSPVRFRWVEGSRMYDVLLSTAPSFLVAASFLDLLENIAATGHRSYGIELQDKEGELVECYRGLVVSGRCGALQLERSRVESRVGPNGATYDAKIGLYFDESTWDGSEIFAPKGTTLTFVTERVARELRKAKVSNIALTSLDEFERLW